MKNILVIAPHPDDEILGCGGTLLRHAANGDRLFVVYMTRMCTEYGYSTERINSRESEIERVCKSMNATRDQLDYQPATLTDQDTVSMIPQLSELFRQIAPDVLYVPNRADAHSDHRVCFNAAYACSKVFRCPSLKTILMYETVSETDFSPPLAQDMFVPNYFVDVTTYMSQKISLMQVYESELSEHPFPRSIASLQALATLRGSAAGVSRAEAFQLIKHIQ